MNRIEVFELARLHGWSQPALDEALRASGTTPDARDWHALATRFTLVAGALALGVALVFFVAYNWQEMGRFGRFGVLEGALLVAIALGVWRREHAAQVHAAMVFAFLGTGVLLAFTGQTYQTGADTWELFAAWAILGFPFVMAGWHGFVTTLWLIVVNLALFLYFTMESRWGRVFSIFSLSSSVIVMVNSSLWLGLALLRGRMPRAAVPGALALTGALSVASFAVILHIIDARSGSEFAQTAATDWLIWLTLVGATVLIAWRWHRDIVALALAAFALFGVFNTGAARVIFKLKADVISLNLMGLVLIGSAALLAFVLTRAARALREAQS